VTALRRFFAGAFISLALSTPAVAQTARPIYEANRSEEDWSALRDPSLHDDVWDPVKYVPLDRPNWFLTVAGEARERYELLDYPAFGFGPSDSNGYLLQRFLLSTDWHTGLRARVFVELQSGLTHGRNGLPVPSLTNQVDLHQGFVDLVPLKRIRLELRIRAGRQELAFGTGRLVSAAEGLNVRRSFDGIRVIGRHGDWTWNAGAYYLVKPETGVFDDAPDRNLTHWGLGAIGRHTLWAGAGFSLYYFGVERQDAMFAEGTARSLRHTVGSRSWRSGAGPWDFNHEAVVQWGSFGNRRIRAWGASSDTGFTFSDRLGTRVGIRADLASGDARREDGALNSFDPLFPSAISYSGNSGLLGPTNLLDLGPTIRVSPSRRLTVMVGAPVFWRQSLADGVYLITTAPVPQSARSEARFVGVNPDVSVAWQIDRHLRVTALFSHFFLGPFLSDTTPGRAVNYGYTALSYRF
jgi:hypothetical protein